MESLVAIKGTNETIGINDHWKPIYGQWNDIYATKDQ